MKVVVSFLLLIFSLTAPAQESNVAAEYPQDYFRNPLDIPILLAGNFGECRPGHFHSGLDIKTQGKEGQPVRAAADGYVSRIKMDKGGFGHALYVTHPNGYTTLYAHLNDFAPAMQQYLKKQQYAQKRWNVDLSLPSTLFPVKKGEQIAWSGNTGGSSAPHLHFEIRNTKTEHPLNPQLFGFEIVDTIAPVVREVIFYERGSFYSGLWSLPTPVEKKNGTTYWCDTVFMPESNFGIGIEVDDYMNGSDNTITFYTAKLYIDDSLQGQVTLDNIGYDETRYINAYIDYYARYKERKWIQCLFQLPGNRLGIYSGLNNDKGYIHLADKYPHKIDILLNDNNGNESKVLFFVSTAKGGLSMSREVASNRITFDIGKENVFSKENISFLLDERQLYDDLRFVFNSVTDKSVYSEKFQLHYPDVPLHHYFELKIKPNKPIPSELKNKLVMKYSDDKNDDGRAAIPIEDGWYSAKVRNFGMYWLDVDTTAPVIVSMQRKNSNLAKARQIAFTVTDDMTLVKTFSGYLDDKWICFEQHGDDFFYKFDEHCPSGKHKLVFKAEDENGNASVYELNFTR